jgi:hypothetical protein
MSTPAGQGGQRPSSVACSRANSVNVASFVLCGCPIVAMTAISASGAAGITDIAIRFWDLLALSRNQKLLPHFGEAGAAVFAVEEIEYGWHDRHLSFDRHHRLPHYHLSWDARRDLDYSPPSLFRNDFAIFGAGFVDRRRRVVSQSKLTSHGKYRSGSRVCRSVHSGCATV